jgi:malonate-semialdehyde dehydrogenase (acetylating)/methylmalonate-semialdehyde dehydrogenase
MTELATSPAEGVTDVTRIHHWLNGRQRRGESGRSGPVFNPATGRKTGDVDFATAVEVDRAVQAAKEASRGWRAVSLAKRAEIFFRIRELVHERRDEVARILTAEHGKVFSDALGEVTRGLEVIEYCCGVPSLLKSEYSEQVSTGIDVYSIRQPLGVVAGITPFNFPAMVPMWMWAPAIACGNCFVLKPSEKDPSASLWMAELLKEAGLPDGVFNVVHGDKDVFRRLDTDREIRLRDGNLKRKALPGVGRRKESHDRAAGRRRRDGCGCGCLWRLRLRRRALHGRVCARCGRRRRGAAD